MVKKVFTMRASSLGDCLMGIYFLENVHAAFPDASCFLVVASRGEMIRGLLAGYPWIQLVVASRREPRSLWKAFRLLSGSTLALTQYSMGGRFSLPSKIFARTVAKSGALAGFEDGFFLNRFLYDKLLRYDVERPVFMHEQDALKAFGLQVSREHPRLQYKKDLSVLGRFGLDSKKYLILHLYSGSDKRGLSPQKRREIASAVARVCEENDISLVVTGTEAELREHGAAFEGFSAIFTAGKTSVSELVQLVAESRAVVSLDTGVAHIAAQVGTALVVLSSYQALNWWSREQYPDRTVVLSAHPGAGETKRKDRQYPESLNGISGAEVSEALQKALALKGVVI